jgi:TPR repeat protein
MSPRILPVALFGFGLGLTSAYALDGTTSPANIAPAIARAAPQEALYSGKLREWFRVRQLGDIEGARKLLEDAARDGDVGAAWELGRMYADGDGVKQNHQLAFEYFGGIADSHADEPPGTAQARFVANAFVRLASYYLTGIPNSNVKPDAVRARDMFNYAASYLGDRDAQYRLGRMYLDGQGVGKDTKQGIRWLSLAADKGQYQAQAMFGALLFKGQYLARNAAGGLMYLILARDAATVEETWITELYSAASKQATAEEVTRALDHVKRWIEKSRSGRRE